MARCVADGSKIAGRRGAAAALAVALSSFAQPLLAQPAPIQSPSDALLHFTRFCGAPTQQNAAPRSPLPKGWTAPADPAPGKRILAEWPAARLLADAQITAQETGDEIEFQIELLDNRLKGDAFDLVTDGAGRWFYLADGTHPQFKNRTCILVSRDDGTAAAAMNTALPHVPHATIGGVERWVFDGGFGAGEDRQMYRRTGFVITGSDGVTYWGLDWTAETLR